MFLAMIHNRGSNNSKMEFYSMTENQLKCYLSLVKTLNFTKTANSLFISESTVSKNIAKLEEELGIKLFKRKFHQVFLTPEGKYFYSQMIILYDQYKQVLKKISDFHDPIKIAGASFSFEQKWISLMWQKLTKDNFQITVHSMNESEFDNIKDYLVNKQEDLILFQNDYFENSSSITFIPLLNSGFSAVVKDNSPLADKDTFCLKSDIDKQDIFVWNTYSGSIEINQLIYNLQKEYLPNSINVTYKLAELLTNIRSGRGIGLVPSILTDQNLEDLIFIPIKNSPIAPYGIGILKSTLERPEIKFLINKIKYYVKLVSKQEKNIFLI